VKEYKEKKNERKKVSKERNVRNIEKDGKRER
jgi:hypothetical protein